MTNHLRNIGLDGAQAGDWDPLCGAVVKPGDGVFHPSTITEVEEHGVFVACGDCQGLYAQLTALAEPSDNIPDAGIDGYRNLAESFRRVVADHTVRKPEALTEVARARRHEFVEDRTPYGRGAQTACERIMYPLSPTR